MTIRRHVMAGVAASGILAATSTPGYCDIGPGDLRDAAEKITDGIVDGLSSLADSLCSWLTFPAEGLPTITPTPLPPPMTDAYPTTVPLSPAEGVAETEEIMADQRARAEAAQSAVDLATKAATASAAQLQTIDTLNLAAPVSVSAAVAVGNAAGIAGADAATRSSQLQAASVALQANAILERQHAREVGLAQLKQFTNYDQLTAGGALPAADHVKMPW